MTLKRKENNPQKKCNKTRYIPIRYESLLSNMLAFQNNRIPSYIKLQSNNTKQTIIAVFLYHQIFVTSKKGYFLECKGKKLQNKKCNRNVKK